MSNNVVVNGKDFYISYLAADRDLFFGTVFATGPTGETALVDPSRRYEGKKYYIVDGNHLEAYKEVLDKGFDSCLELYRQLRPAFHSDWSDD